MNRREFLAVAATAAIAAAIPAVSEPQKWRLFEVEYSKLDYPYVYVARSREESRKAYRDDVGEDDIISIREVPDDEVIEYGDGDDGRTVRRETAAELAAQYGGNVPCCILCDAHYC